MLIWLDVVIVVSAGSSAGGTTGSSAAGGTTGSSAVNTNQLNWAINYVIT